MSLNTTVPANIDDNYAVPSLPIESISGKEDKANKGIANGYAPLDANAKVPSSSLANPLVLPLGGSIDTRNGIVGTGGYIKTKGDEQSGGYIDTSAGNGGSEGGYINTRGRDGAGGSIDTSGSNTGGGNDGGSINTSGGGDGNGGSINTSDNGGSINTSGVGGFGGGSINTSAYDTSSGNGGNINTSAGIDGNGGSINTSNGGGSINTSGGVRYPYPEEINMGNGLGASGGSIDLRGGNGGSDGSSGVGGSIQMKGASGDDGTGGAGGSILMNGAIHDGHSGSINLSATPDANGGSINLSAGASGIYNAGAGGSITSIGSAGTDPNTGQPPDIYAGGSLIMSAGMNGAGGSINTSNGGGSINTKGVGSIQLGVSNTRTTLNGSASATDKTITLPNETGTVALTSDSRFTDSRTPTTHYHGDISNYGNLTGGAIVGVGPNGIANSIQNGTYQVIQPLNPAFPASLNNGSAQVQVSGTSPNKTLTILNGGVGYHGTQSVTINGFTCTISGYNSFNKPLIGNDVGVISAGSFGTTQYSFCQGNDARLNLIFDLYQSGVDIGRTLFWSEQITIPSNIAELTGGFPCLVTDISCIVTNRMGTGTLFITPPSFSLENISTSNVQGSGGLSHSSALSVGNKPLVGAYSRNTNEVGTSKPSGKAPFTAGGSLFVNSATLPQYLANSLVNAIDGTQTTMTQNAGPIFSASDTYVKIDNEIVLITNGGAGLTPTIVRGQLGTAPATHGSGAQISTNIGSAGGGLLAKICFTFKRFV